MRTRLRIFVSASLSISVIWTLGCASVPATPVWVNGELPPEFPKQNFVTALGTGSDFGAAQVAAKAELSRVFSAKLTSEIELIEQESVVGDLAEESSEILIKTEIASNLELQGVEIPRHWRDPETGEVWALAVLERRKECLRIRNEGQDLTTQLAALGADSSVQSNPLAAVRVDLNAVRLGTQLDELQARSRVIGSQCLAPRTNSTGALKARLDKALRALSFVVSTQEVDPRTGESKGPLSQLRERIAGNLSKMGFQVGPASDARVIPVEARLRLRRVERGTDWIEYRWEGSAEVGSPVPGAPAVIAVESEGAESHPENSTARLRARRKGELDLARKLDMGLKAFLAEGEDD